MDKVKSKIERRALALIRLDSRGRATNLSEVADALASAFGISRESARGHAAKAARRLRHLDRSKT
jgi:DNA-directed RNA polymerase sigma subunit (sigma70/sigma32)